jgi:hypothetical protein
MEAMRARTGTRETPPTLWTYAAVAAVSALIGLLQTVGSLPALAVFALLVELIFVVLVLRGGRVVWCLVVASDASWILSSPVSPKPWWTIAFAAVSLACLLAPPSWRFVWRPRPGPVGPPTGLMTDGADGDQNTADASGWYIDPDSPHRMRYWHAEDQRWLGVSKTPRKLRKLWQQQRESEGVS